MLVAIIKFLKLSCCLSYVMVTWDEIKYIDNLILEFCETLFALPFSLNNLMPMFHVISGSTLIPHFILDAVLGLLDIK